MTMLSRRSFMGSLIALPAMVADEGWIPLFDGKSLDGWRSGDNSGGWSVRDGCLESTGARSQLFYEGLVRHADFKNFELKAEVMTRPGGDSGILFHTMFQSRGYPERGFEVQVCNTSRTVAGYSERKKTGSLYGVRNTYKSFVKDDEWFELHITVRGKNVQVRLNGTLLVDYIEPDQPVRISDMQERILRHGTFALQGHDPDSVVRFRNILVRALPDEIALPAVEKPTVDDVYLELLRMSDLNFPVVDYHVHLKGGWTLEDALKESRRTGIQYGIAVNCGVGFPITDDGGIQDFLRSMANQPVFVAMQAEGREWVKMFSREAVAKFDYVFTDAMTFTDDRGKRMRLWINEEVGEIADRQRFMNVIVDQILSVLNREPIDIYVNPTFLPEAMAAEYDALWTPDRMGKVIEAARKNDVAVEINNRYRIPSARFLKLAKQAGIKFSFGTNNTDRNLGRLEYCLEMVDQCDLTWQDIFVPRADGEKAIQRKTLR